MTTVVVVNLVGDEIPQNRKCQLRSSGLIDEQPSKKSVLPVVTDVTYIAVLHFY